MSDENLIERLPRWIAWHLPRWIVYWCYIRLVATSMREDEEMADIHGRLLARWREAER